MLIYLGASAVAAFCAAVALLFAGQASLLATTHLALAVAVLPLIFGAMAHFVPVLTRSAAPPRAVWLAPLPLQFAGILAFLYFSGAVGDGALYVAAAIVLAVSSAFAGWLICRARRTLGQPHPGWRWYLAAVVMLALGLALVPALLYWPSSRQVLRLLHLHLNTLGFIGLTAIGTVQVLLPTVLSGPDADATARLRRDLPLAVVAVLAVAAGAAFWRPLSLLGGVLLLHGVGRVMLSWWRRYGPSTLIADGAAASLAGACCGFVLLLVFGAAHAFGVMSGHDAVPGFVASFLLPLVSGALTQLLPVWSYPGRRTAGRERMRATLVSGGALRTALFLTGGALLACGVGAGLWLSAAALLHFVSVLIRAFVWRS